MRKLKLETVNVTIRELPRADISPVASITRTRSRFSVSYRSRRSRGILSVRGSRERKVAGLFPGNKQRISRYSRLSNKVSFKRLPRAPRNSIFLDMSGSSSNPVPREMQYRIGNIPLVLIWRTRPARSKQQFHGSRFTD